LLSKVTKGITGGQEKQCPKKGLLSTGTLSLKCAILNRIGDLTGLPQVMARESHTTRCLTDCDIQGKGHCWNI
jgi:hypothetical protein